MPPILPNPPMRGDRIEAHTIARIIAYLRAITPRTSARCRVSTTANGTIFDPIFRPRPGGRPAGIPTRLFGIEFLADRVRVHGRRRILHRLGLAPLKWLAGQTDILHSTFDYENFHDTQKDVVIKWAPNVTGNPAVGTISLEDPPLSEEEYYPEDEGKVTERLYSIHIMRTDEGPPEVWSISSWWPSFDRDIISLFGDHPVEEEPEA